jgi:transposase, IS6 family
VSESRPALFRGRHFGDEIIVLCLRWYLRYPLSYRNLEEMMAERGLQLDHSTIARRVLRYGPVLNERVRSQMRHPNRSWRVDETYIRVAGRWTYLYRAIDSTGNTIDFLLSPKRDLTAARDFLRLTLLQAGERRPRVINADGHPAYPSTIEQLKQAGELGQTCHFRRAPEQHSRTRPSFCEASGGQSRVPVGRGCSPHDCWLRSNEHDPQGAD